MTHRFGALLVAGALLIPFAHAAQADDGEALARKYACTSCHQLDTKVVGPAYNQVAERYDESDKPMLVQKVLKGGAGNWGQVPMPPHQGRVPEEDVSTIVDWVLSLK